MAYLGVTLYLLAIILQPAEWIPLFEGVPIQELLILFTLTVLFISENHSIAKAMSYQTSKLFLLLILVSIISSVPEGFSYALGKIGYKLIKYFLGYLIIITTIDSEEKLTNTFWYFVISGAFVGLLCIRLFYTGFGVGEGIGTEHQQLNWRGSVQWIGSFTGTNTTGSLLVLLIAYSFGLFMLVQHNFKKLIILTFSIIICWSFVLTHSRGGTIGLIVVLLAYGAIITNINLKKYIPIALMIGMAVILLKPQEEGRSLGESSTSERIALFHYGLQTFKENPILGVGSGQFAHNNPIRKVAHNIYLQQLTETGFIGAFVFTLMYYVSIINLLTYFSNKLKD